jgi:hypothetical protein
LLAGFCARSTGSAEIPDAIPNAIAPEKRRMLHQIRASLNANDSISRHYLATRKITQTALKELIGEMAI